MTYRSTIVADAPEIYWRLGDAAGSVVAADSSGNGNDGVLDDANSTPAAALIVDPNSSRLYSGPGGSTALAEGTLNMGVQTALSVEGWYKTATTDVVAVIGLHSGVSSNTVAVFVGFPAPTDVTLYLRTFEAAVPSLVTVGGLPYTDGNAHHFVATADAGSATLYFDGAPVGALAYTSTDTFDINQQSGGEAGGATTFTMDEVAFYTYALTDAQVFTHYTEGVSPTPTVPPTLTSGTTILKPTSWRWEIESTTGTKTPWYPTLGGTLDYTQDREIPRTVGGLSSIAQESAKFVTLMDKARLYLVREDEDDILMGTFYLSENTIQLEAYVDDNTIYDINHLGLGDVFLLLRRSTGEAETIFAGADPSQEMRRLLDEAGIPNAIAGSAYATSGDITWDGSETLLTKIGQLADLAGHLPPWAEPSGIVRSEPVDFVEQTVHELLDLSPETGSIAATQNFLTAPNRVIVTGTEGTTGYALRGQWDAPSIYVYSEFQRGYVLTESVDVQGLQSSAHAEEVARAIGLQNAASSLSFTIPPTELLNEPRLVRFRGLLWRVDSWSLSLEPNSRMQVKATLYAEREEA